MAKNKTKKELFLELAQPDADGKSRWVYKEEFVGEYAPLNFSNGYSWIRGSSSLQKEFKTETRREGNKIVAIRLIGYNTEERFQQDIKPEIKAEIRKRKCVMLGINGGKSENTKIEVDHKDGRKNNPRVSDMKTQTIDDFQPLCKAANDIKRQICKECKRTNKRWDAKNIKGNPYSFYKGDENYTKEIGCEGCYQYDPVEYRKMCIRQICQECCDEIVKKLYPSENKE